MKAILIDDENKARKLLTTLLNEYCPQIKELFEAETLASGVSLIKQHNPDIVFLDIEMPEHSGLEILEFFEGETIDFQIIFITAYNKYAIEAFKLSAIDYLLKPIATEELIQAVAKAETVLKTNSVSENLQLLKQSFKKLSQKKLALEVPRGIIFIEYDDILYFEADGMYTTVHLKNAKKEVISKPLKYFSQQLEHNPSFYKPHRSFIININQIKEFNKKDGGYLIMANNYEISISRDKKEPFFKMMAQVFS